MSKLIMLVLIVGAIYFLFIRKTSTPKVKKEQEKKELDGETMIECKECNIYVSTKDSIIKDGVHYCSKECAGIK